MGTRKTLENMQTAIDNAYDSIEEMGGDVPQARNLVNLSGTIDDLQNSVIAGVRGTNDAYQSTGKSYTKGESCIYNNVVYTAKDAISAPAGEFDPSKWDESSLASLRSSISDIKDKRGTYEACGQLMWFGWGNKCCGVNCGFDVSNYTITVIKAEIGRSNAGNEVITTGFSMYSKTCSGFIVRNNTQFPSPDDSTSRLVLLQYTLS